MAFANSNDVFGGSGLLSFSGTDVVYNGTTIGTYTMAGGTLAVTFGTGTNAATVRTS